MDEYDLQKSQEKQDLDKQVPYKSKIWNYLDDMNGASYTNNGLSLVQFNLNSMLMRNEKYINMSEAFLMIPIVYTGAFSDATNGIKTFTPAGLQQGLEWMLTPKASIHLIQSIELLGPNGESLQQMTANLSFFQYFKLLSQMSLDDLSLLKNSYNLYPDDSMSYRFTNSSTLNNQPQPIFGNGSSNNTIFPIATPNNVATASNANFEQQASFAPYGQAGTVYNTALQERSKRIANNLNYPENGLNNLMDSANFDTEYRPYFTVSNNQYLIWYDYVCIKLGDILEYFRYSGLAKGVSGSLRFYLNTGYVNIAINPTTAGMEFNGSQSSFQGCCPFMINQLPATFYETEGGGGQTGTNSFTTAIGGALNFSASCTIFNNNIRQGIGANNSVILAQSNAQSKLNNCRIYFPLIELQPEISLHYLKSNERKRIIYNKVLVSNYNKIMPQQTFSQPVNIGTAKLKTVCVIPFISGQYNGLYNATINNEVVAQNITPFAPYLSPFASEPSQTGSISLTQFQITLNGVNLIQTNENYTFEQFLEQTISWNNINSAQDYGISSGLKCINQYNFEQAYRLYVVDASRGSEAEIASNRNIQISFLNNTKVPIDIFVFIEKFEEVELNVGTGMLTQLN